MLPVSPQHVKGGCVYWHDCFTCPFTDCEADKRLPKDNRAILKARQLHVEGLSISEIARQVQKTERTIYNYLKS